MRYNAPLSNQQESIRMSQVSIDNTIHDRSPQFAESVTRPVKVIKRKSGWQAIDVPELWAFRDLLLMLAMRDVRLRYKQTALGVIWVVLQPLISAAIFAFVFGKVAKLPSDGVPFFVFAYAGLLGWNLFSTTLTKVSMSLVGNTNLVSKVYFPRLVLPLSTVFSTLLDFVIALAMLTIIMAFTHVRPGLGLVTLPIWASLLLLLSLGVGLFAAALAVTYRDIQYILPVATQFLLYASPVAYALSAVPKKWHTVYMLNPISSLLEGFRWSLLNHGALQPSMIAYASAVSIGVFLLGAFAFRRMERQFADVI
jgi:lipopolysaccharide transport system permease protein